MLVDQARIFVKAGNGGNGSSSFRREKYVPKGGPDGGDGGSGGDVILTVVDNLNSLLPFQYVHRYEGENGGPGLGRNQHGKKGKSKVVKVPPGTVVYLDEGDEAIADLTTPGEEFVIAKGGKGGLGNVHFKSSTHQSPRIAELGEPGEERWLRLELRLIADVGLVGLPNAGKSTLLASGTRARPKIADYPFTTLSPNLGVVSIGGPAGQSFVMADIPGLIEGAAEGAGLGHEFLRHVHRTKVLLHVLDASGGLEGRDPLEDYRAINAELFAFDPIMASKPMLVALNKVDLNEARENLPRLHQAIEADGHRVFDISAATGQGIEPLLFAVGEALIDLESAEAEAKRKAAAKPKRRVYTIGNVDERAWDVQRTAEDAFVVTGIGIERFTRMTNFDQWEATDRFQRVLDRSGISAELGRLGIQEGDTVTIANHELIWGDQIEEDGSYIIPDAGEAAEIEWFAGLEDTDADDIDEPEDDDVDVEVVSVQDEAE